MIYCNTEKCYTDIKTLNLLDWTDSPLIIYSRRNTIVCGGDLYDRQKNIWFVYKE